MLTKLFISKIIRKEDMDDLNCTYRLKEESVGSHEIFLRAEKFHMVNGKEGWSMKCVD